MSDALNNFNLRASWGEIQLHFGTCVSFSRSFPDEGAPEDTRPMRVYIDGGGGRPDPGTSFDIIIEPKRQIDPSVLVNEIVARIRENFPGAST